MTKKMKDPGSLLVCEKMCSECLFTKNKIVDDDRKAELIASIEGSGSYFVCHRGTLTGNDQLCCRGFYDNHRTITIAMAQYLDVVKFVPIPTTKE